MSVTTLDASGREAGTTAATAGIDWAKDDHAVALVAADGVQVDRWQVPHTAAGLRSLVNRLVRAGVS